MEDGLFEYEIFLIFFICGIEIKKTRSVKILLWEKAKCIAFTRESGCGGMKDETFD